MQAVYYELPSRTGYEEPYKQHNGIQPFPHQYQIFQHGRKKSPEPKPVLMAHPIPHPGPLDVSYGSPREVPRGGPSLYGEAREHPGIYAVPRELTGSYPGPRELSSAHPGSRDPSSSYTGNREIPSPYAAPTDLSSPYAVPRAASSSYAARELPLNFTADSLVSYPKDSSSSFSSNFPSPRDVRGQPKLRGPERKPEDNQPTDLSKKELDAISLEKRINEVISQNQAIVETLDPFWKGRYMRQSSREGDGEGGAKVQRGGRRYSQTISSSDSAQVQSSGLTLSINHWYRLLCMHLNG